MTQLTPRSRIIEQRTGSTIKTRFLPEELSTRYAELAVREDKLSVDDAITLLDLRETTLYEQLSKPAPDYDTLAVALADLRMAHDSADSDQFDMAANRFAILLKEGGSYEQTWTKLEKVVGLRQRMVETERRRLVQENSVITLEQARQLISRLVAAIDMCVRDEELKGRIMREFRRVLQAEGSLRVID